MHDKERNAIMLCGLISPTYQYIGSNRNEPQNQPDIHSDSLRQDSRNHTDTWDRCRIHRHQHTKYHLDPSDIQVDRCTGSFQEHSGTFQSAGKATPSQRIHQHLPHTHADKERQINQRQCIANTFDHWRSHGRGTGVGAPHSAKDWSWDSSKLVSSWGWVRG